MASMSVVVTGLAAALSAVLTAVSIKGVGWIVVPLGLTGLLFGCLLGSSALPLSDLILSRQAVGVRGWLHLALYLLIPVPICILGVIVTSWTIAKILGS